MISDGWELTQLIQNRWLIPLDQSRMPNFHRYAGSIARDPPFDPGNRYTRLLAVGAHRDRLRPAA